MDVEVRARLESRNRSGGKYVILEIRKAGSRRNPDRIPGSGQARVREHTIHSEFWWVSCEGPQVPENTGAGAEVEEGGQMGS